MINVFLYSYKNKELKNQVLSLVNNTASDIFITVYDQNVLNRSDQFKEIKNIFYEHVIWDDQKGTGYFQEKFINGIADGHILLLSDDVTLPKDWDLESLNFIKERPLVLSGMGGKNIVYKDLFSFTCLDTSSESFTLTNWIDRSFIFGARNLFNGIISPYSLKYYGQEELYGLELFKNNIEIYSFPSWFYLDNKNKKIENTYAPFSLEHNYNGMIKKLFETSEADSHKTLEFLKFHSLSKKLVELPYQTNDVSYSLENTGIKIDSRTGRQKYLTQPKSL